MYTNNFEQFKNFIYFIVIGMIVGILFDIFRISRKTIKTSDIITNIEDIIYSCIAGIIVIYSIYLINNGELRLYIFIGIIIGFTIYMTFISKYFIKINVFFIKIIKKIVHFILKPFILILKLIRKFIFKPISFVFINIKKISSKVSINFINITKKVFKRKDFKKKCRKI